MRRLALLAAVALLAGACGTAPVGTAFYPLHAGNGQITGTKALTGRSASVSTAPPGSAYAGMAVEPPAPQRGD